MFASTQAHISIVCVSPTVHYTIKAHYIGVMVPLSAWHRKTIISCFEFGLLELLAAAAAASAARWCGFWIHSIHVNDRHCKLLLFSNTFLCQSITNTGHRLTTIPSKKLLSFFDIS